MDEQEQNQKGGGSSRSSKKPKLSKAKPQRGLGVAKLEMILRDQQQKMGENTESKEAVRLPHQHSHFLPPPPPPPVTMPPLMTTMNNLSWTNSVTIHSPPSLPMTTLCGSSSGNLLGGDGGGGVYDIGGSVGHGNVPILWNFIDERPKFDSGFPFPMYFLDKYDPIRPSSSLLQSKHFPYPSSMMNVSSSSTISSFSPPSSGLNHHTELPSNQRFDNYSSMWSEEGKMDLTRRRPFATEDQLCPLPPNVPPCIPQMHKTDLTSSSSNKANFRDVKKGGQSKPNSEKGITDYPTLDANFLSLGPPATSLQSTPTSNDELSELNFPPSQGSRYDLQQWSGQGSSSRQIPFYSFLPPKEQVGSTETTSSLGNSRGESGEDTVDLNLKLSMGSSDVEQ